jgi:hypothetical protein
MQPIQDTELGAFGVLEQLTTPAGAPGSNPLRLGVNQNVETFAQCDR